MAALVLRKLARRRRPVSEYKRTIGAYYSPESYARTIVRWALNGMPGSVLDPSYGGCAMLRIALEELTALSVASATSKIYGADIDGAAADWAAHLISQGVPATNLRSSDFLALRPGRELPLVEAVVGNPPYVRHHRMSASALRKAAEAAEIAGARLSGRASLWAYFVVHACRFVKTGGRMALLLPGAVLQADYASAVLRYVERCFVDVLLVRVSERIFDDAAEETVVLLASNARQAPMAAVDQPVPFRLKEVRDISGLQHLLAAHGTGQGFTSITTSGISGIPDWKAEMIPHKCWELLGELLRNKCTTQLGRVARVTLGTVTVANDFFLLKNADAAYLGVQDKTMPVVSRSAWLTGPHLSSKSLSCVSSKGRGNLLALPGDLTIDSRTRLGQYIKTGEIKGLQNRRKCHRDPWWSLGHVPVPDAFLPYTVGYPRGLVLNAARAASTNTIHQVTWHNGVGGALARSWALSTWSVLGRLCAELFGRHYGGGVLKLELAEAQRLPVIVGLQISSQALAACSKSPKLAAETADSALLSLDLGLTNRDLILLQSGADALAQKRNVRTVKTCMGSQANEREVAL